MIILKIFSFLRRTDVLLFALLCVVLGNLIVLSDGFYRVDEGAHFVFDAIAPQRPELSLGVWQRFGSVWLFALPAQLGHRAVQILGSVLFLFAVFFAYKTAEITRLPGKEWIIVLAGFQPAFLDIGFTCMAELPAAFLLMLSYYLYRRSEWMWSIITASLVFLFRYEMSVFAAILFIAVWNKGEYKALPWIVLGPMIWYLASVWLTGDVLWLPHEFLRYSELAKYEPGVPWWHYFDKAPGVFGWIPLGLFLFAVVFQGIRRNVESPILIAAVLLNFLISTMASMEALHWTGGVGDVRYLTTTAPFLALVAGEGLGALLSSVPKPRVSIVLSLGLAFLTVFQAVRTVEPHTLNDYDRAVISLTQEAASDSLQTPILANHWAARFAVLDGRANEKRVLRFSGENLASLPRAYVVWEPQLSYSLFSPFGLPLDSLRSYPGVHAIDSIQAETRMVYLFRKE